LPALCGTKVKSQLNIANFENTFFNFNTNSNGVQCQAGQSLYYNTPDNYDVIKSSFRKQHALIHALMDIQQVRDFVFQTMIILELNILIILVFQHPSTMMVSKRLYFGAHLPPLVLVYYGW
jgi:hypothetical protein